MATQAKHGYPLQRIIYATVTIAVFGLLLMDQISAQYLDDECKGVMGNRDLYEFLAKVCDDCANVYRSHELGQKCRQDCFFNKDFVQCALSTERRSEIETLNRYMSIIRAGRK